MSHTTDDDVIVAAASPSLTALCAAPRPPTSRDDPDFGIWFVEYMDWYFKTRGPAITAAIAKAESTTPGRAPHSECGND